MWFDELAEEKRELLTRLRDQISGAAEPLHTLLDQLNDSSELQMLWWANPPEFLKHAGVDQATAAILVSGSLKKIQAMLDYEGSKKAKIEVIIKIS